MPLPDDFWEDEFETWVIQPPPRSPFHYLHDLGHFPAPQKHWTVVRGGRLRVTFLQKLGEPILVQLRQRLPWTVMALCVQWDRETGEGIPGWVWLPDRLYQIVKASYPHGVTATEADAEIHLTHDGDWCLTVFQSDNLVKLRNNQTDEWRDLMTRTDKLLMSWSGTSTTEKLWPTW